MSSPALTLRPVREVLVDHLAAWDTPHVELALLGTADPDEILQHVERHLAVHLGADPVGCRFWRSSVGMVAGLVLDDGREVVLKAHQADVPRAHLRAVGALRRSLHARGYPTAELYAEPAPFGSGHATLESFIDAPEPADAFRGDVAERLARELHTVTTALTALGQDVSLATNPLAPPSDALWPRAHSKLFDLTRKGEGAAAIDELAEMAKARVDAHVGAKMISHLDWRVEHVRFREGRLAAVFDWDSVHRVSEMAAVGSAAAHFGANWITGFSGRRYPTPEESDRFIGHYAAARGRALDDEERREVAAWRTYGMAYAARCGFDPEREPEKGTAGEMLNRYGERYMMVR